MTKTNNRDDMPRGRSETISNGEIIAVAKSLDGQCFGVSEVAEEIPIGVERTRQRLLNMRDSGELGHKKIGRSNVFWIRGY
jgi:hypothetical protein